MTTTDRAPDFSDGKPGRRKPFPSAGKKLGPAWQEIWDTLRANPAGMDRITLAERVAPKYDLSVTSLVTFISLAAKSGVLVGEPGKVSTTVTRLVESTGKMITYEATRTRTIYRIPS
ncbi:MAG: hypothetical protein ABW022_08215 [Actinoplanes sp.]